MGKRIKVKPSKAQSMMGFFVGIVFVGIGLFMVIPIFGVFGIFWTVVAVIITVTNGMSAFSEKGVATHSIEIEDTENYEVKKESIEARFEKLNNLYQQNLISIEEYEKKKKELLQEL